MRKLSLIEEVRNAWADHGIRAVATNAYDRFTEYCGAEQPRIPGMDTVLRMAVRVAGGMTSDEAAAREYVYRWSLSLGQWINHAEAKSRTMPVTGAWKAPHLIGM